MKKNKKKEEKSFVGKVTRAKVFLLRHFQSVLFSFVFILLLILRFYDLNGLSPFGWDQVDNAWAAEHIIVNHQMPLLGMQAKGNSGLYIGPLYYYAISIVYFLTNLDPIASGIFAGLTSVFTILTLFIITKKLFSFGVAIIAIFINVVAYYGIVFDRVQWPVNFIPSISLIIFYCLYKIITGNPKFIVYLGIVLGISFHIHFTSFFYPFIILFSLPFFPRNEQTAKYGLLGILFFSAFLAPSIIAYFYNNQNVSNALSYQHSYYHGLHFRRVVQLVSDAFIQFEFFLKYDVIKWLKYFLIVAFVGVFFGLRRTKKNFYFCYLLGLFFIIPWFVLSNYSGEISDYYFSINRFLALIIISYFLYRIYTVKRILPKICIVAVLSVYAIVNLSEFFNSDRSNSLNVHREKVFKSINQGMKVEYQDGVAESYLYFYYMRRQGKTVY